jgi:hypothetical protein
MRVEQIRQVYDTPGRKWESGHMRGALHGKGAVQTTGCSFPEALDEALELRRQIDLNDQRRAQYMLTGLDKGAP